MAVPTRHADPVQLAAALMTFCNRIDATGGVLEYADGAVGPKADPGWTDLGDSYLEACRLLGREPRIRGRHDIADGDAAEAELTEF